VWQQTLDKVHPDGTVDVSTALTAFALAIGPVPGVVPPTGTRDDIVSGTIAIRWVTRVWSKLTVGQRQAIQDALTGAASPGTGTHTLSGQRAAVAPKPLPLDPNGPNVICQTADSAGASPYRALVDDTVSKIESKLNRPLRTKISIAVDTKAVDPGYMYTQACVGNKVADGKGTGCSLHVTPKVNLYPSNSPDTSSALAHEVMHCFVFDRLGNIKQSMLPDWYGEGMPNWVASSLGPVGGIIGNWWRVYLDTSTQPLGERTYDGIGFFVHLAESGVNPWGVIDKIGDAMANGGGTAAGWNAAGVSKQFLDSWGSGYVEGAGGMTGRAWTTSGPGLPSYQSSIDTAPGGEVANGKALTVDSPAQATWPVTMAVSAEVVQVQPGSGSSGRISLGKGTDATLDQARDKTYCTQGSDKCRCPQGSAGEGTVFTPMEPGFEYVGVTGGLQKGSVTIAGQSLDEFCNGKTSPLVGTWKAESAKIRSTVGGFGVYNTVGGRGVAMTIAKDGRMTLTYNGMAATPYTITAGGTAWQRGTITAKGADTAILSLTSQGKWLPKNVSLSIVTAAHSEYPVVGTVTAPPGVPAAGFVGPVVPGTWTITGKTLTIVGNGTLRNVPRQSTWVFSRV
jgi:hypothetical protein